MEIFSGFAERSKAKRIRTMREFAEAELIVASGDAEGLQYKVERQPFCRFWFEATENPKYNTFVAVGPTQSGKSLLGLLIPVFYHLFEVKENVIIGVPTMQIAESKWYKDFKRMFDANPQFAELLPTRGPGSHGGMAEIIQFAHGPILRFMTGGGSDKTRAEFTARVVAITEVDGFRKALKSEEADPIRQLIGRTRHYKDRRRVYEECTVTTELGKIWQEWLWSGGQIVLTCPHCHNGVIPIEVIQKGKRIRDVWREAMTEWQEAKSEIEAEKLNHWRCPKCKAIITEDERYQMNLTAKMIFNGQEIDPKGEIVGPLPGTRTFSLRWSAVNNFFTDAPFIGSEEWKAANTSEADSPELEQSQFVWAVPIDLRVEESPTLTDVIVRSRIDRNRERWTIPDEAVSATYGVDLGIRVGHYCGIAAIPIDFDADDENEQFYCAIFDYGVFDIHSDDLGTEIAIPSALRDFRDDVHKRFPDKIDQIWCDARYFPEPVYEVCRDEDDYPIFRPVYGYGADQERQANYRSPKRNSSGILYTGNEYHIESITAHDVERVELNSSFWKLQTQEGFILEPRKPNSLVLFRTIKANDHFGYAKHITAEVSEKVYELNKGYKTIWRVVRKANHYLDCTTLARAALDFSLDTGAWDSRGKRTLPSLAVSAGAGLSVRSFGLTTKGQ